MWGLSWRVELFHEERLESVRHDSTAPSWSWASRGNTRVSYTWHIPFPLEECMPTVLGYCVEEEHPGSFGRVKRAHLHLQVPLWRVVLKPTDDMYLPPTPGYIEVRCCGARRGCSGIKVNMSIQSIRIRVEKVTALYHDSGWFPPVFPTNNRDKGLECWILRLLQTWGSRSVFLALEEVWGQLAVPLGH